MAQAGIRVSGGRTLRRTMKAAGQDMTVLKEAHAAAARIVIADALAHAPHRTGALAASLRPGAAAGQAVIRAGRARVPYAGPIHWGWPSRHIKAQPFIWVGAVKTRPQWMDAYLDGVNAALAKIKGAPGP